MFSNGALVLQVHLFEFHIPNLQTLKILVCLLFKSFDREINYSIFSLRGKYCNSKKIDDTRSAFSAGLLALNSAWDGGQRDEKCYCFLENILTLTDRLSVTILTTKNPVSSTFWTTSTNNNIFLVPC